jgi:hypothetical protein
VRDVAIEARHGRVERPPDEPARVAEPAFERRSAAAYPTSRPLAARGATEIACGAGVADGDACSFVTSAIFVRCGWGACDASALAFGLGRGEAVDVSVGSARAVANATGPRRDAGIGVGSGEFRRAFDGPNGDDVASATVSPSP